MYLFGKGDWGQDQDQAQLGSKRPLTCTRDREILRKSGNLVIPKSPVSMYIPTALSDDTFAMSADLQNNENPRLENPRSKLGS